VEYDQAAEKYDRDGPQYEQAWREDIRHGENLPRAGFQAAVAETDGQGGWNQSRCDWFCPRSGHMRYGG
jgi:hypothetical protein